MNKLKRSIACWLVLAFVLSMVMPASAVDYDGRIVADCVSALPGETVDIQLQIETNPGISIAALSIKVKYGDMLTLVGVTDGDIMGEDMHGKKYDENPYNLTWNNMDDYSPNGTLVVLSFLVSENAVAGDVLEIDLLVEEDIYNINEEVFEFDILGGSITVARKECTHVNTEETAEIPAGCENEGYSVGVYCNDCGVYVSGHSVLPALGHSFTEQTTEYPATEANCAAKATYYYSCANAGCNEKGTETFESGEKDASKHVGGTEIRGAEEATEEKEGYTGDLHCKGCDAMLEKGEAIPALAHTHNLVKTEAQKAACESNGNIAYWTCNKCDKIFADADATNEITFEDTVVKATGHSFVNYVSDENATCVADGTETAKCENCHVTDTRVVEGSKEQADHSFPAEYTSDGNATCTVDGTKSRTCTLCAEKETVTDVGSALGHVFTNYVSDGNAACETDGTKTAKCDRCEVTDTVTDTGSALGHDFTEQTTAYPATEADCCHKATYYYSCANAGCDKKGDKTFEYGGYDDTKHVGGTEVVGAVAPTEDSAGYTGDTYCMGCNAMLEQGTVIPPLDHEHDLEKTEAKEAACDKDGNIAYWTCAACGGIYADAEGTEEITAEDTVVKALGHTFTNYVSDGNATCETDGTKTAQCDRCDATDTVSDEGSASGHSYGEWVVIIPATCTGAGLENRVCANCGETENKAIAAQGHDYKSVVTDPTETEKGYTTHTCTVCGESYVDSYVDPKPEQDKVPETGDMMTGGLWMSMMALCLVGMGVVLNDRKKWLSK